MYIRVYNYIYVFTTLTLVLYLKWTLQTAKKRLQSSLNKKHFHVVLVKLCFLKVGVLDYIIGRKKTTIFFPPQNSATATSDGFSKTTAHIIPNYAVIKHFTALLSTLGASLPEWNSVPN